MKVLIGVLLLYSACFATDKANPIINVDEETIKFSEEITFNANSDKIWIERSLCEIQRPSSFAKNKSTIITPKSYQVLPKSYCKYPLAKNVGDNSQFSICKDSLNTLEKNIKSCETVTEEETYINHQIHFFIKDKKSDLELELICQGSIIRCETLLKKGLTIGKAQLMIGGLQSAVKDSVDADKAFLSFLPIQHVIKKDQPIIERSSGVQ
jgi:hypothetical protein